MRLALTMLLLGTAFAAAATEEENFAGAAVKLNESDAPAAADILLAYAHRDPTAPLANQALDVVLMLDQKKATSAQLVAYVRALGLLADGFTATADVAFRELAAKDEEPWAVRGRAYLIVSELNVHGDARAVLEEGWRDCPDETGRLIGIALADAYHSEGDAKKALAVRDEFIRRFPGDPGISYFDYLLSTEKKGEP